MRARAASLCVLIALATAAADSRCASVPENGFFIRKDEGWFWYHDTLVEPADIPPFDSAQSRRPEGPPDSPSATPLSAAWLAARLPHYLNAALDDPSPENVSAYLYLQRYTLDKSMRFADAAELAVMTDPFLDENTRRPIATFGAQARTRAALDALEMTLISLAQEVGVYFFYRSDCPYCAAQAPILQSLEANYGLRVMAVSLDGRPLPGNPFPDYVSDGGQAGYLNVVATPALFLVKPEPHREVVQLSQGLLSLSEFEDRLIKLAHEAGWIDDTEFERTQPYDNVLLAAEAGADQPSAAMLEDPAQLIAFLRTRIADR